MKNENRWLLVNRGALGFWLFTVVLTAVFNVLVAVMFLGEPVQVWKCVIWASLHAVSLVFFVVFTLLTNRSACLVRLRDGVLERRGLFFGFRKEVAVSAIERIDKIFYPLDGAYYVLVDKDGYLVERVRKRSAICVPCSESGVEFIKHFWNGPIPPWYTDANRP